MHEITRIAPRQARRLAETRLDDDQERSAGTCAAPMIDSFGLVNAVKLEARAHRGPFSGNTEEQIAAPSDVALVALRVPPWAYGPANPDFSDERSGEDDEEP